MFDGRILYVFLVRDCWNVFGWSLLTVLWKPFECVWWDTVGCVFGRRLLGMCLV